MIDEVVKDALTEVKSTRLANPVEHIDFIVLAGGSCQMDLMEDLFRKAYLGEKFFQSCRFIRSPSYECAVSEGLAIEACANSRLHEIRPTRVAPYLQDDIKFLVSHRVDGLEVPRKLRARTESLSDKLRDGIIIAAPQGISALIGKKLGWSFSLTQRPREIFYALGKSREISEDEVSSYSKRVKFAKQAQNYSTDLRLDLFMQADGFADLKFEVLSGNSEVVIYDAGEVDLHDLSCRRIAVFRI
jgi:hypothetical protein